MSKLTSVNRIKFVIAFCVIFACSAGASDDLVDILEQIERGQNPFRIHPFPFQVGLLLTVPSNLTLCGGSLISDQYVLTAAHCVQHATEITVVLGALHIFNASEPGQLRMTVNSDSVTIHEKFEPVNTYADLALIKLPEPVQSTAYIHPIKLPKRSSIRKNYEGTKNLIMGWGSTKYDSADYSETLQYGELPIVGIEECGHRFYYLLSEEHFCARSKKNISTCFGDSGGPLVHKEDDGTEILLGVVTYAFKVVCRPNWPSFFIRVDNHLDWISKHTGIAIEP